LLVLKTCPVKLGERVRLARKSRGLTQETVAEKAGLRQGAISNIENGTNPNPGFWLVLKIADAIGCELTEIVPDERPTLSDEYLASVPKNAGDAVRSSRRAPKMQIVTVDGAMDFAVPRESLEERVDRMQGWIQQLALHTGVALEALPRAEESPQSRRRAPSTRA